MSDRVGQKFGHYRLIRKLGSGGFADVYLGTHIYLGNEAAIKVIRNELSDVDKELFRNEGRNLVRLIHPHIVRLLDFGIENDVPYFVMDYAPNGSLRVKYPQGTLLPLTTIVAYVKQIAEALQYAHDQKLIHRDVKPENMLLGRNNEVLLSDFGIAVVAHSTKSMGNEKIIGTSYYMAPEQLNGQPRTASDQYSLGVIIYSWLTGTLPFTGTYMEIVSQQLTTLPPPLRNIVPSIPIEVEHVVLKALEKDRQQRYKSIKAFAQALEQASQKWMNPAVHVKLPIQNELQAVKSTQVQKTKEQWIEENNRDLKSKKFREAIADCDRAIALDPHDTFAYHNRGVAHHALEKYQLAIADYDRAITLNPKNAFVYHNLGVTYYALKKYQRAIENYNQAIALIPEFVDAYHNRGIAYEALKMYQQALEDYNSALAIDPNDTVAKSNREKLYRLLNRR